MSPIEAVVLTGGRSRRMGTDKAKLVVDGVPQGDRIVWQLLDQMPVTVLGREPNYGAMFIRDKEEFGGPIAALSAFEPSSEFVFVASCDLPLFDLALVTLLKNRIGDADACVPVVDDFRQPLCALYTKGAFAKLATLEDQCAMGWLDALNTTIVTEREIVAAGIDPRCARGANTPEELEEMLKVVRG